MVEQYQSFEQAFFTYTAWYCGDGEEIDRFTEWLKSQQRNNAHGLDMVNITPEVRNDFEEIGELLSCMILMFGTYGTSPQYGWIEQVDNALNWLRYVRMYWADDEE